ncbi:putative nucleotidyltransferase, ribonuclease H [Tanacetum coccineum]
MLEPLSTPKGPWESVSMDFITCLPKSEGGGSIIVVVDRFLKYGTFIAAPPDVTADDTAKLFFKNVVKYWGVPHVIVSDRDPRFMGRFWTELFKIMGTNLNFSMKGSSPAAYKTIKEWHEQADLARASLDKAAKKMKKWANEKRRHVEFEVGDQVMVKLLPQQFKSLRKVHKGLIRRYEGHFPMIGRVGKEDPERGVFKRAPTAVVTSYDREVEEILSDRTIRRREVPGYKEYLIKWRDLPDSEASWEAKDLLWQFADEIKRHHEDGTTRTSHHHLRRPSSSDDPPPATTTYGSYHFGVAKAMNSGGSSLVVVSAVLIVAAFRVGFNEQEE